MDVITSRVTTITLNDNELIKLRQLLEQYAENTPMSTDAQLQDLLKLQRELLFRLPHP